MINCYITAQTDIRIPWLNNILTEPSINDLEYILINHEDMFYYKNNQKIYSAKQCYQSVLSGQHSSILNMIKRQNKYPASILDATCGWGKDTISFAQAGINVIAYEREIIPASFFYYALETFFINLKNKIEFHFDCFSNNTVQEIECVYVDPLFFDLKKSLSKKSMELLYELTDLDENSQMITLAHGLYKVICQTLITKTPKNAPPLFKNIMTHSRFNRTCRFDIYYVNHLRLNESYLNMSIDGN